MSLDVYLSVGEDAIEDCPHCGGTGKINHGPENVYQANITHNLATMAGEAGIYKHLWRPGELGITKASELIEPLRKGLELMRSDRARFEAFNSPNGWGRYDNFVPWVAEYLGACEEHPDADVSVWG